MTTITNNEDLNKFVSEIENNKTYYAVRTKENIYIFKLKTPFNAMVKKLPNSVHGELTTKNYMYYRFTN